MHKNSYYKNIASLVLLVGLLGCQSTPPAIKEKETSNNNENLPLVIATTSVICDLTQQIAVKTVNLKCLVAPGEDPHIYQPKPEDRKAIDTAKLILYAGYNFDPSLIKLVKASSNTAPKIAVHEVAVAKPFIEKKAHGKGEKQADEETLDPHIWHDPKNGIAMVKAIADSLTTLEPNNASIYANNSRKITEEISQIDSWIKLEIATIPANQRKLVTTHDALGYYVNAYGLQFQGALEGLSTEVAPTAARVSELVKDIKTTGVPTIYAEISNNSKLIKILAKEANVKVSDRELYADGLGEKGSEGNSYQKMLIANTRAIVEGLGGKYKAFEKK
jgi:manganese/iron transport system substrate-binding protein